jgi:hypothetical protein
LTWSTLGNRLCGRSHAAAASVGDTLVGMGVSYLCDASVEDPLLSVETYAPIAGWTLSSTLTFNSREGMQLLRSGPNLYAIGGFNDSQITALKSTFGTNLTANFKVLTGMAVGRAYAAGAALPDGRIFMAGGHNTDVTNNVNAVSSTELFTPDPTLTTGGTWAEGPPLGIYRAGASAVATSNGEIWVMGPPRQG